MDKPALTEGSVRTNVKQRLGTTDWAFKKSPGLLSRINEWSLPERRIARKLRRIADYAAKHRMYPAAGELEKMAAALEKM